MLFTYSQVPKTQRAKFWTISDFKERERERDSTISSMQFDRPMTTSSEYSMQKRHFGPSKREKIIAPLRGPYLFSLVLPSSSRHKVVVVLGEFLKDRTILFLVILMDKTASVG